MIYGMLNGEYSFFESGVHELWSDHDCLPVSARNYAHSLFSYEETEHTEQLILDELNDFFGTYGWYVDPDDNSTAIAITLVPVWPYMVRRKVTVVTKYHAGVNGWREKPYDLTSVAELMEPMVSPKVYIDCD